MVLLLWLVGRDLLLVMMGLVPVLVRMVALVMISLMTVVIMMAMAVCSTSTPTVPVVLVLTVVAVVITTTTAPVMMLLTTTLLGQTHFGPILELAVHLTDERAQICVRLLRLPLELITDFKTRHTFSAQRCRQSVILVELQR